MMERSSGLKKMWERRQMPRATKGAGTHYTSIQTVSDSNVRTVASRTHFCKNPSVDPALALTLFAVDTIPGDKLLPEARKRSPLDLSSHALQEMEVEVQVVERDQTQAQNLLGFDEVAQVAARELAAGRAGAAFFNRALIVGEGRIFEIE